MFKKILERFRKPAETQQMEKISTETQQVKEASIETQQVEEASIEAHFETLLGELSKIRSSGHIMNDLRIDFAEILGMSPSNMSETDLENLMNTSVAPARFSTKLSEIVGLQPVEIPFFTTDETQGIIAIRFQQIDTAIEQAVRNNNVVFMPQVALYDTYPVLCLAVIIYDQLEHPYVAEGFSMIDEGNVQEFFKQVIVAGGGEIQIYSEESRPFAKGSFKLQAPQTYKYTKGKLPIPSTDLDRITTMTITTTAASHLESIPKTYRDFNAAAQRHMSSVPAFRILSEDGILKT